MQLFRLSSKSVALAAIALPAAIFVSPASAGNAVSYVSRSGNDTNACTENAPCRSFQEAYEMTDAGGTIHCQDTGNFGALNISKSITVSCKTAEGFGGTYGAFIDGAGIQVVLRGLAAAGGTDAASTAYGVAIFTAGSVIIEDCSFRDVKDVSYGYGIWINTGTGTSEVLIRNTTVSGSRGPGMLIKPGDGIGGGPFTGGTTVTVENSTFANNNVGIRADTRLTSGRISLTVTDSVLSGNTYQGLVAEGGTGKVDVFLDDTTSSDNLTHGIRAINATATIRLSNSNIINNGTGTNTLNGGQIYSYGDNKIIANGVNGPVLSMIGMQ